MGHLHNDFTAQLATSKVQGAFDKSDFSGLVSPDVIAGAVAKAHAANRGVEKNGPARNA